MLLEGNTLEEKAKWLFKITENLEDALNDYQDQHEEFPHIFKPVCDMLFKHWKLLDRNTTDGPADDSAYQEAINDLMAIYVPMYNIFLSERYGFVEISKKTESEN
ncbi:hypothetical protein [Flavobacterium sp.]|uniref:hypothetical protein n=1 Tax=Flavobacterium sp. TaxID=239 RepID=UPI001217CFFB|nr:hypothetical protein [Flavobacterium sp.]RZJ71763.1 MAG: hypothetical protein EOO49_08855 [Flavobacterium sp.]